MYHVYLLQSEKRTYIGMTDDPLRRLRQHNREITGGARATAGRKWKHVCVLSGFPTRRSALQFEWMWKHMSRRASLIGKMETIAQIWKRDYSSSTSIHFSQFNTPFFLSFSPSWTGALEKIESIRSLQLVKCAARFQTDYDSFQLFPFPLISKMSSTVSNVVVAEAAAPAVAAVVEEKKKAPRKPKTAPVEEVAAAPAEKPKKEKKATAAAPTSEGEGEAPVEKKARKPKTSAAAVEEPATVAAAAPAPEPAEAPKEAKPKKAKKAAASAAESEPEPVIALPGSTAALAAGGAGGAPLMRADAMPLTDAETTDAEGGDAALKEKKPRKPRAKKAAAVAPADLPLLDAATLDALDMAGKVALLKDHVLALTAQVAALTAASSDDESATGGKKQRKKREPKAKAVCPAAADGVIRFHTTLKNDYKALSNSHKADITIDGVVYPTVEHYYQCAKFLDTAPEYADKIRNTANAALVKNMGRTKKVEIRPDWETVQLDVMRKALHAKFAQHDDLAAILRGTGAARLEEESPSDAYWGIGADGAGENHLGELLAEIRARL